MFYVKWSFELEDGKRTTRVTRVNADDISAAVAAVTSMHGNLLKFKIVRVKRRKSKKEKTHVKYTRN